MATRATQDDHGAAGGTTTYCPACGEDREHKQMLRGGGDAGTIYRCAGCGLRRLLPLPDPISETTDGHGMYAGRTHKHDANYERQVAQAVSGYLAKLSTIGKRPYTMLDLGGGMGYYSRAFAHKGLTVTYLDRDPVSFAFAAKLNEKAGVVTFNENIEDFARRREQHGRFDLIFFRHVIEHCHHPDRVLEAVLPLCNPAGVMVLETDNNRSIEHLLHPTAGPYWQSLYRDHYGTNSLLQLLRARPLAIDKGQTHYYAFRKSNLRSMLMRTGWDVVDLFDYRLGDPVFWPNEPAPGTPAYRRGKKLRGLVHTAFQPLQRRFGMGAGLAAFVKPYVLEAEQAHPPRIRAAA